MTGSFFTCIILLAFAGSSSVSEAAPELRVQAAVSTKKPYLGDTVILQIHVEQGIEKLPEIETSALESLGASSLGQPALGHSRTIINGVSTEKFTYQFRFQFTPTKAGTLTIPAVTVRQGKETAATMPFDIQVVGPEAQDLAIVELIPSDRSVYPGQTLTLTVSVLLRRLSHQGKLLDADPFSDRDPPQLKVSWLEGTEILKPSATLGIPPRFVKGTLEQRAHEDGPSFLLNDLFVRTSISLFEPRTTQTAIRFDREAVERTGRDGEEQSYFRYSLPLEYRVTHSGSVGPLTVSMRGSVFTGVRRGGRGLEAESLETFVVSEPLSVHALAVPKAGQPRTFTGGIGLFKISATAQPTKVRVGDPITVSVRVTGTGNLEEIGPPDLLAQEKWNENFKIHEDASPGRIEDNAKVFTISVRPKTAEVKELPSIQLSYFNPKLKKYEDTYTDRISLEVAETARLDSNELVDLSASDHSRQELEELSGGLAANYLGADMLAPQEPYLASFRMWLGAFIALPIAWCATYAWHRRMMRLRQNPALRRAQRAYSRAIDRLRTVSHAATLETTDEVARSIAGYLADRLNLSTGELTPAEAHHHATSLGAASSIADRLSELLERCDQSRFARHADSGVTEALVQDAREILEQIDRTTARNGRRGGTMRTPVLPSLLIAFALFSMQPFAARANGEPPLDRRACLERANAAFERGAREQDAATAQLLFRAAIADYERLIADGVQNGKLYYNLANAHFRSGDVPRAILNYRLAERLMPRDGQIAANLAFARSRVPDPIEATETSRLLRQLLVAHYALSVRERMHWVALSFVLAWFLLGIRIWVPSRALAISGLVALLVCLSLAGSVVLQLDEQARHPIGVLVANEVLVRKGDGETYEPQFNRPLGAGTEFRVLSRRGDWLHIELSDGKSGWIQTSQAAVANAPSHDLDTSRDWITPWLARRAGVQVHPKTFT